MRCTGPFSRVDSARYTASMNHIDATAPVADSPQRHLAAILDGQRPATLLTLSLNPMPVVDQWCQERGTQLTRLEEPDPFDDLARLGRFDLVIVADQLEYMTRDNGTELLGLLRNLHTNALVVLYQPQRAPDTLRWPRNDFLGMGLRREADFEDGERSMTLYSYELDTYNFRRAWNNPQYWANPENWGRYWW